MVYVYFFVFVFDGRVNYVHKFDNRVTDKYDNPTRRLLIAIERGRG